MRSLCVVTLAGLALVTLMAAPARAGEVQVTITNVETRSGQIFATLQTQDQFMRAAGAYNVALPAPTEPGPVVITFPDVAPGDYAFGAMHDEDGDNQMKMTPEGMPLEGWALANAALLRGPPDFATVKITVGADPIVLTEEMHYPPPAPAAPAAP